MAAGPCKHNTRTRLTRCVSLFAAFLPLLLHSRAGPPEAAPRVLLQVSLICPLQSNGSLQQQLRQTHAAINSVTYSNLSALAQTTQIFVVLKSSKFLTDLKPSSCPEYILQEFQQYSPVGSPPVKLICQNSSTDLISTRDSIFQEMQFNRNHSNAIMFLDHCETFVDDSALAQFVKVFQKTQDGFVFSNIFKAREGEYEEVEFTEESYNPYDITIATTLNTEEPNEKRSPIPPTTSMLVPLALMEKYYKSRNVAESICAAGIKEFETSEVQASSLDIQKFWHLLALSDVGAYFIPVPLLIHTGTKPSNAHHDRRMIVNLKAVKAKFPLGIKHLATLKSRWRPSVSVIIPFYNVPHGLWFLHTMRSISVQSFSDFEIIIVDDGSDKSFESFGFLSELEEKVLQNDGLWDGELPFNDFANMTLVDFRSSAEFHEELPPPTLKSETKRRLPIPLRVITHHKNRGLSEARNTGVRAARSHQLFFLDPDGESASSSKFTFCSRRADLITKTHLEKISLAAVNVLDRPPRRGRRADVVVGFIHFPVTHFATAATAPITSTSAVAAPPPPAALPRLLRTHNPVASAAVVSRWAYMRVGGMCARVRGFEDWDFWVRLLESRGVEGAVVGDAGFWYRRHAQGLSAKANLRNGGDGLKEIRSMNPTFFGDMSRPEAMNLLRNKNGSTAKESADGEFMPCYKSFNLFDADVDSVAVWLQSLRGKYKQRLKTLRARWSNRQNSSPETHDSFIRHESILQRPLYPAHIFPFNLAVKEKKERKSLMYMIPWMVAGGADLYDLQVLKALNSKVSTTLVVERNLETHPHPWSHLFSNHVDEIFHLQLLSNDSQIQGSILDYLAESRDCQIAVNSRTVTGYSAFERWGELGRNYEVFDLKSRIILMDILHMHHPAPDNSNWEHRSGRVSRYLTRRVVVSQELRNHLINIIGHGDVIFGQPSDKTKTADCWDSEYEVWRHRGRCVPLVGSDAQKIVVVHPPVVFPEFHSTSEGAAMLRSGTPMSQRPALFFAGRVEAQKDPIMWLRVASKAQNEWQSTHRGQAADMHIIGAGSLLARVHRHLASGTVVPPAHIPKRALLDESPDHRIATAGSALSYLHGEVPQRDVARLLARASANPVLLVTSRLEGVSIVILESLALGVPVVTLDCGGIGEVFEALTKHGVRVQRDEAVTPTGSRIGVSHSVLGAIVHVRCESLPRKMEELSGDEDALLREVEDIMAEEVIRLWQSRAVEDRWDAGGAIRTEFGIEAFARKWRTIFADVVKQLEDSV
ncbi:hypothetical protein HDU84_003614 [Entophlyctis sp. JEL0112]|nr:hypothetical protein HDU84_003614 [Entophlyctis sp. JEL0112]